jgi:IS30 family transposase
MEQKLTKRTKRKHSSAFKAKVTLDVTIKQVLEAGHTLNNRPRKCLGVKTPSEVLCELSDMNPEKMVVYALIS